MLCSLNGFERNNKRAGTPYSCLTHPHMSPVIQGGLELIVKSQMTLSLRYPISMAKSGIVGTCTVLVRLWALWISTPTATFQLTCLPYSHLLQALSPSLSPRVSPSLPRSYCFACVLTKADSKRSSLLQMISGQRLQCHWAVSRIA